MAKSKQKFQDVNPGIKFPEVEEKVLKFWKENQIFEKSVQSRPEDKTWTFLDGPPFITGLPHYGSLLSSIPKDLFPRFWTMKGYRVRRVWGWDCHGLPAENKVENKLGIKRKKDIEEKIGVKKFIDECKLYVKEVSDEWEWYVDHIGRWVDFKNAYKTMDVPYMESVMWVFKQMYEKGFIYKGLRVSLYCPHCSTPISNFEVAMDPDNYQEVTEPSNVYKYELKNEKGTFLLAWSTTPWNKLATPALAVNPNITYAKVEQEGQRYILAKETLKILKDESYKVLEEFPGKNLVGLEFVGHYDYFKIEEGKRAFVVVGANFVTAEDGTGVVTLAAYGEDDLEVMQKENIQVVLHVDEEGKIKDEVPNWGGRYYLDVNGEVNEDLRTRGLIYREDPHTHTVPTCWRCHTKLLYAPQNAWYVNVQKLKEKMEEINEAVNWFPPHFKYGRFLKSLQAAPDWCISRSRYWGSPVPVWECKDCGERFVAGSIEEIEKRSGKKISDLHKPEIDDIVVKCEKCGKDAHRVPEVLDSWIEAGSASFAERHYPFAGEEKLEDFFPPDFIVEYTGQIRAWFYVLHVIASALFGSHAFKNVVVTGVILGTDGRKMSKNFGNYPDPKGLLQEHGGDALRLYLMGSPVMSGEDIRISEEDYAYQVRGFLMILWNIYNFFVTYANLSNWEPMKDTEKFTPKHIMDKWILSTMKINTENLESGLKRYETPEAINQARNFIVSELSTWYVRRVRDRVNLSNEDLDDKNEALQTLWTVLTEYSKVLAPIIPFTTEEIYKNLTGRESVHLEDWPDYEVSEDDRSLYHNMSNVRKIAVVGNYQRKKTGIPTRQPLFASITSSFELSDDLKKVITDELNIKLSGWKQEANLKEPQVILDTNITPELEEEGKTRELARSIQEERKNLGVSLDQHVAVTAPWIPENSDLAAWLKKRTLATSLEKGDTLKVKPV